MNTAAGTDCAASFEVRRRPWRILLVDDCTDDVELVCLELASGGVDAECRRVDSETALLEALRSFAPELVLSDVNMPGFSGQRALEVVDAQAPALPFVFLSDGPVETTPGSGLSLAAAHVSKDRLELLPTLVRRMLAG